MFHELGSIRVSFAAILRIKADDRYVLLETLNRPGAFSPPGGVFKYFWPAVRLLEDMGFHEDRIDAFAERMQFDLRGILPAAARREFCRWFASRAYREDTDECLRRELAEELTECGLDQLVPCTQGLVFSPLRTVSVGPHQVPGQHHRQLRRIEVCDLVISDPAAQRVREELVRAGHHDAFPSVIAVTAADIKYGRSKAALITAQAAYLIGSKPLLPDVPAMR